MNNFPSYKDADDSRVQKILDEMSRVGIKVEESILQEIEAEVDKEIEIVSKKIFSLTKSSFNLNSPQQVSDVLYVELGLPVGKKRKSGFATDEKSLNHIKNLHPIVPLLLEYRTLSKIKSTYLSSLRDVIKEDGRIHTTFLVDVAKTGRIVSRDPNLQNIPIRNKWGELIRKSFVSESKKSFLAVDYSQIELRLLAHLSQESKMIKTLTEEGDIHLETASEIFNKSKKAVTKEDRRIAKTVNFSIIYGVSPHGLSETLEIEIKQAAYLIETYLEKYPGVKKYLDEIKKQAYENGFVTTLGGVKKNIPEIKSDNHFIRKAGERMALNYPIQGSAAEIIKLAMIKIDDRVKMDKFQSKMILQIHDELLFEVEQEEFEAFTVMVKEEMESIVSLRVPLLVSLKRGQNWGELEDL